MPNRYITLSCVLLVICGCQEEKTLNVDADGQQKQHGGSVPLKESDVSELLSVGMPIGKAIEHLRNFAFVEREGLDGEVVIDAIYDHGDIELNRGDVVLVSLYFDLDGLTLKKWTCSLHRRYIGGGDS
ncbi:hypothetical protein [Haloferula rosea]|uniref:Uncharacterized protein n=1 Tax=Haloferula rosea TaxID=490093 RepID=A0A934VGY7_9BACT|nr:hypothetical protein [Haloferula rosea]MBK1828080.1 hypothetical protein [Haloferula rosea]